MMSSVSPLQPIGKLVTPGPSASFYGLGPSSVSAGETVSSTVNCIGVDLSPSSSTISSSSSTSFSTLATTLTTTSVTTNSIVNLINCSTPLPSLQSSPSSTIDSENHVGNTNTNTNDSGGGIKTVGKEALRANVPHSWRREKINGSIVYISPSSCFLWSRREIADYLVTEGTCKCGLECPIILEEVFNFDPRLPSISSTPTSDQSHPSNCNHSANRDDHFIQKTSENYFQNNNPINSEYPPKTCNHRRRNLTRTTNYSTNQSHNSNSDDSNFSTTSTNTTTSTTTTSVSKTTVNDTPNHNIVRLTQFTSPIPEPSNQLISEQFSPGHHLQQSSTFHPHNHHQQLANNSIPFFRGTHHQSIINPGVTIFKSDANFTLSQDKEPLSVQSTLTSDSHTSGIHKDFQHQTNSSPLSTNSYINWLPLNASDDNRLSAIVNESQPNVQAFANTSSSSLPGFTDVISGINLATNLIDPHNPGGGQLVQLYNPVQYTSVTPNAVALLSPAQTLPRDGSATILIPSLVQSTDHHHHHHTQQPSIVLNPSENNSTGSLEHQARNLLPSLQSTAFSSIPLQTPYAFQPQLSDSYSAESSPSPTHSYEAARSCVNNNDGSFENSSDNSNRTKNKSKAKTKLIKRRSPRYRKAKENSQRLNRTLTLNSYFNQKQEPEKLVDQVSDHKETIGVDESSKSESINGNLIDNFGDENEEEPMDSQNYQYEENHFTSQTEDEKDFEYEKIDDSAQCTSEDIMRELSSHQNATIRNVGVQSDELEPESPEKSIQSTECSNEMVFTANNDHENNKNVTEEEYEEYDGFDDDEDLDDDVYSIHSNLPDSEESSEKDKMDNLKTTCEFVLQDDEVSDSFNELDNDLDQDDDEFDLDGNSDDNELNSSDDLSVNFATNSDNNNNISINSDINSFDEEDEDDHDSVNYDNQNTIISISTKMTSPPLSKQPNHIHEPQAHSNDASNDFHDEEVENERYEDDDEEKDVDRKPVDVLPSIINTPSTTKPAEEGLFGRLSISHKLPSTLSTTSEINTAATTTMTTATATFEGESTKESRNNKRLERLRKELLCYENNFDQTTAQSPPLSPQVRSFETGDLVWGQMRGNPSWPGKLISKDDVPGSTNGQDEQGKVWVKWFGDNLVTQVELDKLKTLSEGLEAHHTARKKHRKGKKMDSCLDRAIQEAMMELDKQIDQQPSTYKSHPTSSSISSSQPSSSSSS